MPPPTLIGIGMVKNEADIIEAFVRHNLHYLDELWLLENNSLDSTPHHLARLTAEGLPLRTIPDPTFTYNQSAKITTLYKQVLLERRPTYIIPLDADEFIQSPSREALHKTLSAIRPNQVGQWLWRTCVPADTQSLHIPTRFALARKHEASRHGKIVIRCSSSDPTATIAQGYHALTRNNKRVRTIPLHGAHLAHLPIRSSQQLAQKAILGWMANVAHFKTTTPACGFHWGDLYSRALDLTNTDLLHEAYNYSERPGTTTHDLMPSELKVHGPAQLASAGTLDHKQLLDLVCRSWEASLLNQ